MGAFTYENVQGALSELVGRRIEVVEKRETGCYSHLLIKTYDRWSALVDGARFAVSPNFDRAEGAVVSDVTRGSEAGRDIVKIHVFGFKDAFDLVFCDGESEIDDVKVYWPECTNNLLFSTQDSDIKKIVESLTGHKATGMTHTEDSVKITLDNGAESVTIVDNKSSCDYRDDTWVCNYKFFQEAKIHDVRILSQKSNSVTSDHMMATVVIEAVDDTGKPVLEVTLMVDTYEDERPEVFVTTGKP